MPINLVSVLQTTLASATVKWITVIVVFLLSINANSQISAKASHAKITESYRSSTDLNLLEGQFSKWVQSHVDTNFFLKKSAYQNLSVDCADFIYAVHAIFAYQTKIPFAFHYLDSNSKKLSFQTIDFRERKWTDPTLNFKKFLIFLLANTNTYTLSYDSELIPFQPGQLRPGVFLLTEKSVNHSWLLTALSKFGTPTFISGSIPESPYLYENKSYPSSTFVFQRNSFLQTGGLRKYKWILQTKSPTQQHQQLSRDNYFEQWRTLTAQAPVTVNDQFENLMEDICLQVRNRVNVVQEDSTPQRDFRIQEQFKKIDLFYATEQNRLSPLLKKQYQNLLRPQFNSEDYCWVQWAQNRMDPLGQLRLHFLENRISSSLQDNLAKRWGYH